MVSSLESSVPSFNFITDRLAVGNAGSRSVPGWRAIVSILATTPINERYDAPPIEEGVPVLLIDVADGHPGLQEYFTEICGFVWQHIKHGCVLINCGAGFSRSVSAAAAYLCRACGMSLVEAFALVGGRRHGICPWEGYKSEISAWLSLDRLTIEGPRTGALFDLNEGVP